jgi:hypothetical protein
MPAYPTGLMPVANAEQSYSLPARPAEAGESTWALIEQRFGDAKALISPADRVVGAFDALKDHAALLDAAGMGVLAGCAEQIVLNHFHGRASEALPVRDAAIALLPPSAGEQP